jgi:hypothetical protein
VSPGVHLGLCPAASLEFYARGSGARAGLSLTQIHIQFEEQVAAVLGINHAEVQQAAMIAVAYPRREDFKPAYREPVQKFTHWDSW